MNRFVLSGAVAAVAVLLAGCPPTYPKCNSDDHCKEKGEVCVQGQCQECVADQNCKEGFVCQGNKCVTKPECTSADQCGAPKTCEGGKCVLPEGACVSDTDCASGKCGEGNRCLAQGACTSNDDCPSGQACQNGTCAEAAAADTCTYDPVYFGFNEYSLSSEARGALDPLADCLKKGDTKVTLEGHADERGTEEYNLQLSNRRAAAVRKYLQDLGVPSGRLEVVGYGETRPADSGSDEDAWAKNRRVEFAR